MSLICGLSRGILLKIVKVRLRAGICAPFQTARPGPGRLGPISPAIPAWTTGTVGGIAFSLTAFRGIAEEQGTDGHQTARTHGPAPADAGILSPTATILLAISFGLCAGYLDVGILLFKKYCWNRRGTFETRGIFPGQSRWATRF